MLRLRVAIRASMVTELYIFHMSTNRVDQLIGLLPWQPLHFVADFDETDRVHLGLLESAANTPCYSVESSLAISMAGLISL